MRDYDIRQSLLTMVKSKYEGIPDTLVVEELGILQGKARVDLAVVNGTFYAYEIKSSQDNLARLPRQVELYGKIFDRIYLVASEPHLEEATKVIPSWWGIIVASSDSQDAVSLELIRRPDDNPDVDSHAIVQLLWRNEALELLAKMGADAEVRTQPRKQIWKRVCEVCTLDEIKQAVRQCLKLRTTGSIARTLTLCGGKC